MSTSKLGSFGALTVKKTVDAPPKAAATPAKAKDRAKSATPPAPTNETVKMTVKLTRADWERIGELRLSHRLPFQQVAIAGLNLFLKEMGQPPLQTPEAGD